MNLIKNPMVLKTYLIQVFIYHFSKFCRNINTKSYYILNRNFLCLRKSYSVEFKFYMTLDRLCKLLQREEINIWQVIEDYIIQNVAVHLLINLKIKMLRYTKGNLRKIINTI